MLARDLTQALKTEARRLGFTLAAACPAVDARGIHRLHSWLAAGYAGEMEYLSRRAAAYENPRSVLDGARSLLMLAVDYRTADSAPPAKGQGRVARYAVGRDYHDVLRERLNRLAEHVRELSPGAVARGVVDSAPILEREFAGLAGLGWIGKNTMLINKQAGSWFFLAALATDATLEYDAPHAANHCGTCRACLDACPTGAFVEPYVLDARKCVSYLTIELKGTVPRDLREGVGAWVFGCDVCQEVCPWNHDAPLSVDLDLAPRGDRGALDLAELFSLDGAAFRARFRDTPLWRPRRRGMLRNAALVLGNQRAAECVPALVLGLNDGEPLVRGAAAWALGKIGGDMATAALAARREVEDDIDVTIEIDAALADET